MSRAPEVMAVRAGLSVERDRHRPSGRLLLQGEMEASYIDLADARHLEFDYLRWMRAVLRAARARRVLHLGGGACALARALADEDPDGRHDVCESDAEVLALVNVVDDRAARDVRAVAAGLAESFPAVWWLGGRVGGNSVLVACAEPAPFDPDVVRARLAADPSPAGVVGPVDLRRRLRGAAPLRDAEVAAG